MTGITLFGSWNDTAHSMIISYMKERLVEINIPCNSSTEELT